MIIINKMRNYFRSFLNGKGFTLIELLVVIGILGVLAAVVLTAIDPLEQFARGRDSGRLSTVDQLGHAAQAYYTQNGIYPDDEIPPSPPWMTALQSDGDLKNIPSNAAYSANGAHNPNCAADDIKQNNYCYVQNTAQDAIIYTRAESRSNCNKANPTPPCTNLTQNNAWIVWDSIDGRTGLLYSTTAPPIPAAPAGYGTSLK